MTGKVTSLYDSKAAGQAVDLINATTTEVTAIKNEAVVAATAANNAAAVASNAAASMQTLKVNGTGVTYDPSSNTITLPTIKGEPGNTGPAGSSVDVRLDVNGDFYKNVGGFETLLGNIKGAPGSNGSNGLNGSNGVGIASVSDVSGDLVVTLTDASQYNLGKFKGTNGKDGNVVTASVDEYGVLTVNDGTTSTSKNLTGPVGPKGADAQSVEAFQVFWNGKTVQSQKNYTVPGLKNSQKIMVFVDGIVLTRDEDYTIGTDLLSIMFNPMGGQNIQVYSFGFLFGGTLSANDIAYTGLPRVDITSDVLNQAVYDLDINKISKNTLLDQAIQSKLTVPALAATSGNVGSLSVGTLTIVDGANLATENISNPTSLVNKEYVDAIGVTDNAVGGGLTFDGTGNSRIFKVDVLSTTPLSLTDATAEGKLRLDYEKLTSSASASATDLITVWNGTSFVKITKSDFLGGISGSVRILGTWNATTNVVTGDSLNTTLTAGTAPAVKPGDNAQGVQYVVDNAGTSSITGTSLTYNVGDQVLWTGTAWIRIASQSNSLSLSDGSAAAPSLKFSSSTNTGIYKTAIGAVGITSSGVSALEVLGTAVTSKVRHVHSAVSEFSSGTAALPGITFTGDTNTGFCRLVADEITWTTGGVAGGTLASTYIKLPAGSDSAPSVLFNGGASNSGLRFNTSGSTLNVVSAGATVVALGTNSVMKYVDLDTLRATWAVTPNLTISDKATVGPEPHTVSIMALTGKDKLVNFNSNAYVTNAGDFVTKNMTSTNNVSDTYTGACLKVNHNVVINPSLKSIVVSNSSVDQFVVSSTGVVTCNGTVTAAEPTASTHLATKNYVDGKFFSVDVNIGTAWATVASGDGSYAVSCNGYRCFMDVVGNDFTISSVVGNDTFNFQVVSGSIQLQTLSGNRATRIARI